ncbi:hypothetical protein BKA67DRAFT_523486, partial [Truncatella angustata]
DISDVFLPGGENGSVPVYDTCDEIRGRPTRISGSPELHRRSFAVVFAPTNIQAFQLTRFRSAKGHRAGTKSIIFYGAYVIFEEIRIKQGKCKSKYRQEIDRL